MTPEQLLIPRYKVIADYPGNRMLVGTILTLNMGQKGSEWHEFTEDEPIHLEVGKDLYPHIFQPLQWWEERKAKDWPQYVRYGEWEKAHSIFKIVELDIKNHYAIAEIPTDYFLPFRDHSFYPSNEEEYNTWFNKKYHPHLHKQ